MVKWDWCRAAAVVITVLGGLGLVYLVGRYLVALLLPFLLAFLLAVLTRPAVRWLSARTRVPCGVLAALVTLLALIGVGGLCYFLVSRLLIEVQNLFLFLAEDSADPTGRIASFWAFCRGILDRIPFIEHLRNTDLLQHFIGDPKAFFAEQMGVLLSRLSEGITAGLGGMLRRLPTLLLFLLITVISCFYFAVEYDTVFRAVARLCPPGIAARLPDWRRRGSRALRGYLRAYVLLFGMTFAELLLGLVILRTEYAFLLALITAVLDILPVLGVGTVLIPWALLSFVMGDVFRGVGLLILYGIITVVRQIAEPHVVGKSLGLHPILMLISFYVGWKLFGVVGIFLGPTVGLLIKAFLVRGTETPCDP
ncbi:MAG: sporulation integral membrane protein YtvI [Clostridia bacterium]|nr:sporulation integral membrane protein YtvI [Clostridia bacterium]